MKPYGWQGVYLPEEHHTQEDLKILILNRRDITNPAGGGAEIYTHEIAKGLVKKYKCRVSVFTSSFMSNQGEELIDDVRYIRRGNELTVHFWGTLFAFKHRKSFDLIIDEFNGIGFFTFPLKNSAILIHQLYREFWFMELGLAGAFPYLIEPLLLWCYRKKQAVTVSESTQKDLKQSGFSNIAVVMNAVRFPKADKGCPKEAAPTIIFLGRLRRTKRPHDAIEIFKTAQKSIPDLKLWIVGRGTEEERLKKTANGLRGITFWGWVDIERKAELLQRAHILLVPGLREGFGINVLEAASVGVPAIGYAVPGLRDSIRHGETGYLVDSKEEAVFRIMELLENKETYKAMSYNCINYSRGFDWDINVDQFFDLIRLIISKNHRV